MDSKKQRFELFDKFVIKNNGYISELWNSFNGGRGWYLFCPICQKEKIWSNVKSFNEEEDLTFYTDWNLFLSLESYKNTWYIKFECNCWTSHKEFKKIFNQNIN